MKRHVVFLVYQKSVYAFRVDSWHSEKLFRAFKKKNYINCHERPPFQTLTKTMLVRLLCSSGQQGWGVHVHFPNKFNSIFSAFTRLQKKKIKDGGREQRDKFSYFQHRFTPFLRLEINFIHDSVSAVKLCKLIII